MRKMEIRPSSGPLVAATATTTKTKTPTETGRSGLLDPPWRGERSVGWMAPHPAWDRSTGILLSFSVAFTVSALTALSAIAGYRSV